MGCLEVCLRSILIVINVVVVLAGVLLLAAAGIFFTKNFDFYPDLEEYSTNVNIVLIPMAILGGILLIVGMIGCIGACTGKKGLLNCYFIVVLVVVLLEVALIVIAIVKKDDVKSAVLDTAEGLFSEYKFNTSLPDDDSMSDERKLAVNVLQYTAECCGYENGSSYWAGATVNGTAVDGVPPGCCTKWTTAWTTDNSSDFVVCANEDLGNEYENGCVEEVEAIMSTFGVVIIAIIVAIIIFELVCLCAACYSKKRDMLDC